MKANEAPKRIYLQPLSKNEIYNHWYSNKLTNDFIEYTRTDAFIEKACTFLKDRIEHDSIDYPMARISLIEDFKNYMKGK